MEHTGEQNNNEKVTTALLYREILNINERMDRKFEALSHEIREMTRVEPARLVQQVNVIERDLEKETRLRKEQDECLEADVRQTHNDIVDLKIQSSKGDKIIAGLNAVLIVLAEIISSLLWR